MMISYGRVYFVGRFKLIAMETFYRVASLQHLVLYKLYAFCIGPLEKMFPWQSFYDKI